MLGKVPQKLSLTFSALAQMLCCVAIRYLILRRPLCTSESRPQDQQL